MRPVTHAGKLPHKSNFILFGAVILAGCAQFTTNEQELAALGSAAENEADSYVACVKTEAANYASSEEEISYVVNSAGRECQAELDKYEAVQSEFLSAQYMMIDSKLEESTAAVNQRATDEVAAMMLTRQPQVASPSSAGGLNPGIAAGATAAVPVAGWNSEQRVYLDCMQDQARKYVDLNENAPSIAEVAQSRCKNYMGGANAVLEQEGRTLVMGIVFDARLQPGRPSR